MKLVSILFLVFLLDRTLGSWVAYGQTNFIYSSADGREVCVGGISLSDQRGINFGLNLDPECGKSAFFGYGSGEKDPVATGLVCPQNDECFFLTGLSDSSSSTAKKPSNGSIKRSVFLSSFKIEDKKANFISGELLTTPKDPGSFYAMQPTSLRGVDLKAYSTSAAPFDRLFIAGTQTTAAANDYFSFVLNAQGPHTGAKSIIFSNPNNKFALGGTMSRDGGIAVQLSATSTLWQLSTRLLNNGIPRKAPFSWTVPAYTGYSPDITNTIEVNNSAAGAPALKIRYLVYRVFRGVGTAGQQSQIVIQRIDDATGKPLEAAKPLTPFKNAFLAPAEAFQSIAIAPSGELLMFTEYSGACKKMILKAARLVNRAVSGAKVIAGCAGLAGSPFGYTGLDITEDPESENP